MPEHTDQWLRRWLRRIGAPSPAAPILELGCGDGRDTAYLLGKGYSVIATELTRERLADCARRAPGAILLQHDLQRPLPFADRSLSVVIASLCLHYFEWEQTLAIVADIRRCLAGGGLLLCRLNSSKDVNFGASGYAEIEAGYFQVGARRKRFFDVIAVDALFDTGWKCLSAQEMSIDRYRQPKVVWEVALIKKPAALPALTSVGSSPTIT